MKITHNQLRQLIREEIQSIEEDNTAGRPSPSQNKLATALELGGYSPEIKMVGGGGIRYKVEKGLSKSEASKLVLSISNIVQDLGKVKTIGPGRETGKYGVIVIPNEKGLS